MRELFYKLIGVVMKKKGLLIIPAISAMILAGCNTNNTPKDAINPTPKVDANETSTDSKFVGAQTLDMDLGYKLPNGMDVVVKGKMELDNGIIKSVKLIDPKGPGEIFQKNIEGMVVGKSVKGLTVDSISGASLTTQAFNKYLSDLNK